MSSELFDSAPFHICTARQRPDLLKSLDQPDHPLNLLWPKFLDQDPIFQLFVPALTQIDYFAQYQFLAVEKCDVTNEEQVIGMARSIPFFWLEISNLHPVSRLSDHTKLLHTLPDGGYDAILSRGIQQYLAQEGLCDPLGSPTLDPPNALSALSVAVRKDRRKSGLAEIFIRTMKQVAIDQGLSAMVVPLRPTSKSSYPKTSLAEYVRWTKGASYFAECCASDISNISSSINSQQQNPEHVFDPWLRKHLRLGGQMVKVAHRSMRVRGSAEQWSNWTGVDFRGYALQNRCCDDSSVVEVTVPGGLVPVKYDYRTDVGIYVEPNIWISHDLKS
ncbi:hypothetical protein N7494_005488 [Penicillium frequentans]|uniref:Uncharacterized protein n=1 Tax=Penicillium frequentans TaxID=3151616 RepID=A0AAD6CUL1_9EURO|nr:hypothetical protein N7494_005488 [Penicillium glabrum]